MKKILISINTLESRFREGYRHWLHWEIVTRKCTVSSRAIRAWNKKIGFKNRFTVVATVIRAWFDRSSRLPAPWFPVSHSPFFSARGTVTIILHISLTHSRLSELWFTSRATDSNNRYYCAIYYIVL